MQILTSDSSEPSIRNLGGGKVLSLYLLGRHGLDTPPWTALGTDVFRAYRQESGIDSALRRSLAEVTLANAPGIAQRIESLFLEHDLGGPMLAAVQEAYRGLGDHPVAIRSSGAEEDSGELSFAGQFASYLNVRSFEEANLCIRSCWASAFSARSLAYRLQHGVLRSEIDVAVIIQRMLRPDRSGVIFTANPITGSRGELVISAVYGMGEGLVSGAVDADTVEVDRSDQSVIRTRIGAKAERYEASSDGPGCSPVAVPESSRRKLSISAAEIAEIGLMGERIESALGGPQDIEWAYAEGRLWLLQSRPVTALEGPAATILPPATADMAPGQAQLWDKSSVSENFGDITTPLTFSFVQHVTHGMYFEHFRLLGIPYTVLREMDSWLRNMFGYFNGRMYNNLPNWVRTNRALPFSRMRREIMQAQMGLAEAIDQALIENATPFPPASWFREKAMTAKIAVRFTWRFLVAPVIIRRFLRDFYRIYDEYEDTDFTALPSDEVYWKLLALEERLVPKFGSSLILHPVISLSVGALVSLTRRWMPAAPSWFPWQAASPQGGVESVEPAARLMALTAWIRGHPEVERIIRETPAAEVDEQLRAGGHDEFILAVHSYIKEFGYRSVNELKFEEPSLREKPVTLFVMLADQLSATGTEASGLADTAAVNTDQYIADHLSWPRRFVYQAVRLNAQHSLRARERVRFCRTRAFGLMRTMFLTLGTGLAQAGAIAAPRDILYLRYEEIKGCFEASIYPGELKTVIASRTKAEATYRTMTAPRRFLTRGPVYWSGNLEQAAWRVTADADGARRAGPAATELTGVPCSQGVAEGEARLMDSPGEASGGIIATYRTDPGWVTVLPSAKGLLVEMGSPLNHIAIVARELGIPAIVQVTDLTTTIRTGMTVRVDGGLGHVRIINGN